MSKGEQRWIPVEDQLPDKAGFYLVCERGAVFTARFTNDPTQSAWAPEGPGPELRPPAPTHWMPLPEPPKKPE